MRLANGFGSVVYLGKKRRKPYGARITVGWTNEGKQIYKYLGYFEKRTQAFNCLVEHNKMPLNVENLTFEQVYEEWKKRKFQEISKSTMNGYIIAYRRFKNLYKMPFKDIRTIHLQEIMDDPKNLSMSINIKVLANQLFKYALKHDICLKDYSKFIELPKMPESKKKVPFTNEEIQELWNGINFPYTDLLIILLYSGMRISELLEMKIENVHLEERYMFVEKSKTSAGIRQVPIHKDIMPLIERRYDTQKKYLFPNRKGNAMLYNSFLISYWPKLRDNFNLKHTIHETRHTFITQASRLDLNTLSVKRIVGHTDKDITEHYTDRNINDLIAIIDRFKY